MDLSSVKTIKNLLGKQGIRPSKGLGQNFLVDKGAIGKIIEAAELSSADTVLEIGPGLGVLTQELAKKAKKVIAVEKDPNMVELLKQTLKDHNNVEVIQGDIRKIQISSLKSQNYHRRNGIPSWRDSSKLKIVGNLPFYLTAPVIRQFLENTGVRPRYMVFVVQKEVGQRICSKPPNMNLLAVSVQFYAEPKIISFINKGCFWPSPEVDAAILKISKLKSCPYGTSLEGRQISNLDKDLFFKVARAGFSQPRKQLINNLSRGLKMDKTETRKWLLENNIQPSQRAETLTIKDWLNLTEKIKKHTIKPN